VEVEKVGVLVPGGDEPLVVDGADVVLAIGPFEVVGGAAGVWKELKIQWKRPTARSRAASPRRILVSMAKQAQDSLRSFSSPR
jgi:hypothetical protein